MFGFTCYNNHCKDYIVFEQQLRVYKLLLCRVAYLAVNKLKAQSLDASPHPKKIHTGNFPSCHLPRAKICKGVYLSVFGNSNKCEKVTWILQQSPHQKSILTSKMAQGLSEFKFIKPLNLNVLNIQVDKCILSFSLLLR